MASPALGVRRPRRLGVEHSPIVRLGLSAALEPAQEPGDVVLGGRSFLDLGFALELAHELLVLGQRPLVVTDLDVDAREQGQRATTLGVPTGQVAALELPGAHVATGNERRSAAERSASTSNSAAVHGREPSTASQSATQNENCPGGPSAPFFLGSKRPNDSDAHGKPTRRRPV